MLISNQVADFLTIINTMGPEITIITVVKDDVDGLKATAASILTQKYPNFEWLIVDGYSSDGSWQYAQELESFPFVAAIQSSPTGIYGAMNIGAKESSTAWIWFINAGDKLLTDESLGKFASIARKNSETSIIASPVVYLTPTDHFFSLSVPKVVETELGKYAIFHHQGCLLNRLVFNQTGGFDQNLKLAADGKLLDSMISIAPPAIAPIVTVGFEMGGATSKNFWRSLQEIRLYRPQSFSTQDMVVFQLKEVFRAAFLFCIRIPSGRKLFDSYIIHREEKVMRSAKLMGLDLARERKSDG
jgi:glycosyltransferase involved in cell wall biosynthesis